MAGKRQRADSNDGAVNAMAGAQKQIDPPSWVRVPEAARPFWYSIVSARASDRWNEVDLENAAELARTKASVERLNAEIEIEGDVITNDRGTPIVNPKHSLLETLTRRLVALSRMLQIHAEATQGKARDQVPGNKAQQSAKGALKDNDEDLISRPKH